MGREIGKLSLERIKGPNFLGHCKYKKEQGAKTGKRKNEGRRG